MLNRGRVRPGASRAPSFVVAGRTVSGLGWLGVGLAAGWLVYATPVLARAVNLSSPSAASPLIGALAWAAALTAPSCFMAIGVARLAGAVAHVRGRTGPIRPVQAMASRLPAGVQVLPTIHLPDGRLIPDVVLGPHGIAFFEMLPPPAGSRQIGGRWEVRAGDGRWHSIESPLERAARDGASLRRYLAEDDCDFLVKVHPAVTASVPNVEHTDGCAVVSLADVPGWLAALPAQRGLSTDRLEHVRELLDRLV